MLDRTTLRRLAALACAAVTTIANATSASAQDLLEFLWSGGSRQTVSFPQSVAPGQIIVSFGDRKLYLVYQRGEALSYPIAVPREQSRWSGVTSVSMKRVNPSWTPTAEMRRENPKLPVHVPGGHPLNPMGSRALYLGSSMYRIHGTDAPWTIGTAVSKGCIRMYNEDAEDLYNRVGVGTKVTVTWKRFDQYTSSW
ncbi:MAG: L,D-transpeptidase [Hyphomicrobiaceae bacterium]|nr:L,D-transpeptidase [Hyphomicrobiaceae bacterium]